MLWVFAGIDLFKTATLALKEIPKDVIDLSKVCVDELPKAVKDYCDHHASGHIYLGFLDPLLMLHPTVEAQMRRGFKQCEMYVVVSNPLLLPLSWKNGIRHLRIVETPLTNASTTKIIDNGSTPQVQSKVEHGGTPTQTADQRDSNQSGKEGSAPKRRKQKRQDQAAKS